MGCVWNVKAPEGSVEARTTLHLLAPSLLAVKLRVPLTSMLSRVPSRVSCTFQQHIGRCEVSINIIFFLGGGVGRGGGSSKITPSVRQNTSSTIFKSFDSKPGYNSKGANLGIKLLETSEGKILGN